MDQDNTESPPESAADKESALEPAHLSRSSIASTPNIVYLNDWLGTRSLIGDIGDDRFGILPRSEAGRRLWRKRQKREQRRAEDSATSRSEDVEEYKGRLSLDELLAFINSAKIAGESPTSSNSKPSSSTPLKKERNIKRKKKPASDRTEDSDQVSVSTMDTSSCSGFEVTTSVESLADAETELCRPLTVPDEQTWSYVGVRSMDYETTTNDHENFVVVQKKKRGRHPVSQLPQQYEVHRQQPYYSSLSTQATRGRPPAQVSTGYEACIADDVMSQTSDAESSSSFIHESCSKTSVARCSSPHFPDLSARDYIASGRRNFTGNVCEKMSIEELAVAPSTISYAIVAAGGLRPNPTVDMESRQSTTLSSCADGHSRATQLGIPCTSADQMKYFCNSSVSAEDTSSSEMPSENLYSMPSQSDVDNDMSDPSTPTDYYSADNRSVVSDDLAKELSSIKSQKAGECLQVDRITTVPVSATDCTDSLVDRKTALSCSQRNKLPVSPVVFLDIANEHRPLGNSLGVSFGFDSSEVVCAAGQSECSSSESGFSDCTVHTDTDRVSSVVSSSSTTSPVDAQDFITSESVPSSMVQTVTVGHCRPIVPFLTNTGHQSCSHAPVGIVPPIPQVDRAAEPAEQDVAKDSKPDIITSVIGCDAEKDDLLLRELVASDKRFTQENASTADTVSSNVSPVSTVCSVSPSSFNLLNAQIFLYTG